MTDGQMTDDAQRAINLVHHRARNYAEEDGAGVRLRLGHPVLTDLLLHEARECLRLFVRSRLVGREGGHRRGIAAVVRHGETQLRDKLRVLPLDGNSGLTERLGVETPVRSRKGRGRANARRHSSGRGERIAVVQHALDNWAVAFCADPNFLARAAQRTPTSMPSRVAARLVEISC